MEPRRHGVGLRAGAAPPAWTPDRPDAAGAAWTAAVINYSGGALVVTDTVASLKALEQPPNEILLVDDGSSDDSVAGVRQQHPDVRIIEMGHTGKPNRLRNRALQEARHRYVLITDNDITFAPDAARRLLETLRGYCVAACTPIIAYDDDTTALCAQGHDLHFLCWSSQPDAGSVGAARAAGPRPAIGCGIQMVDRSRVPGGLFFEENCELGWGDDGEFHYRLALMGAECLSVPEAVGFHRRIRGTPRYYGQVHNRWLTLLKDYQLRTLVAIAPALLLFEGLLVVWLAARGVGGEYLRAIRDVAGKRRWILEQRRRVQQLRKVPDREILSAGDLEVPKRVGTQPGVAAGLALLSALFRLYWRVVRVVI